MKVVNRLIIKIIVSSLILGSAGSIFAKDKNAVYPPNNYMKPNTRTGSKVNRDSKDERYKKWKKRKEKDKKIQKTADTKKSKRAEVKAPNLDELMEERIKRKKSATSNKSDIESKLKKTDKKKITKDKEKKHENN